MARSSISAAAFLCLFLSNYKSALGQCEPVWSRQFALSWPAGTIQAAVNFDDDGDGPHREAVILAGKFLSAGGVAANHIVKWDGTWWSPLGAGLGSSSTPSIGTYDKIYDMAVFDEDGSGPGSAELWVAGYSQASAGGMGYWLARWNGIAWTYVTVPGGSGTAFRLLAHVESNGTSSLFAAMSSGSGINGTVWKYSGGVWTKLGSPLAGNPGQSSTYAVNAMRFFDEDGQGPNPPRLFVAGSLVLSGGTSLSRVARWNGSAWERVGTATFSETITSLEVFDPDGDGPAQPLLIAGGFPATSGAASILLHSWNGATWSSIATLSVDTSSAWVSAMAVFDPDGPGPIPKRLWITGRFERIGQLENLHGIAWWDGNSWHNGGYLLFSPGPLCSLNWPQSFNSVPRLLFLHSVQNENDIFGDGSSWVSMPEYTSAYSAQGPDPARPSNDPIGGEIIAAGLFRFGTGAFNYPAVQYDGLEWRPLGNRSGMGIGRVIAFADQDGMGPQPPTTIMLGDFSFPGNVPATAVQYINGQWIPIPGVTPGAISGQYGILSALDIDGPGPLGPQIFVAGKIMGQPSTFRVARWTGSTWDYLPGQFNSSPTCMVVHDEDGNGSRPPNIYVAGFDSMDGVTMNGIAKWDGIGWKPLVNALTGTIGFGSAHSDVTALYSFDPDGNGPQRPILIASGSFITVDGVTLNRIAYWDGGKWNPMGSGFGYPVAGIVAMDEDGAGPGSSTVFVGGDLKGSGGQYFKGFARWNGQTWDPLWESTVQPYPGVSQVLAVPDLDDSSQPPALWGFGWFYMDGNPNSQCMVRRGIDAPYFHAWSRTVQVTMGSARSLRVAAGGAAPLAYQWRRNGQPLADGAGITGTTTDELTIAAVSNQDVGQYDCVVTNPCGSVISSVIDVDTCLNSATPDVNGDGVVNGLDIQAFVFHYLAALSSVSSLCRMDLNSNNTADAGDATVLVQALLAN